MRKTVCLLLALGLASSPVLAQQPIQDSAKMDAAETSRQARDLRSSSLARKRDVDMLASDNASLVNLRVQKSFDFARGRRIELSGDVFNLFNSAASYGFLSTDARSANFGKPDNDVQPRVGQVFVISEGARAG